MAPHKLSSTSTTKLEEYHLVFERPALRLLSSGDDNRDSTQHVSWHSSPSVDPDLLMFNNGRQLWARHTSAKSKGRANDCMPALQVRFNAVANILMMATYDVEECRPRPQSMVRILMRVSWIGPISPHWVDNGVALPWRIPSMLSPSRGGTC